MRINNPLKYFRIFYYTTSQYIFIVFFLRYKNEGGYYRIIMMSEAFLTDNVQLIYQ
jgi:hypothetical protein